MKTSTQLALWYFAIVFAAFLVVGGWAYYELVIENPGVSRELASEGQSLSIEFAVTKLSLAGTKASFSRPRLYEKGSQLQ